MNTENKLEHSMSEEILLQYKKIAFIEGVRYALTELHDVYGEGLQDTDIYKEFLRDGREG